MLTSIKQTENSEKRTFPLGTACGKKKMQKCLQILIILFSITPFAPCLARFSPLTPFVGGIMHSAARKLECECHVSVHFDQMWALFGGETQTADSSYAGKMSREPPSNTQHWALLCLPWRLRKKWLLPERLLFWHSRQICPSRSGRVNYPSRHLPCVPFPPTQSRLKFYTFMLGWEKIAEND